MLPRIIGGGFQNAKEEMTYIFKDFFIPNIIMRLEFELTIDGHERGQELLTLELRRSSKIFSKLKLRLFDIAIYALSALSAHRDIIAGA